ncbi:MAG: M48 family peptidase, partial [Rhodocyclaceae bacterium]|nr:M48 family peptidase [Rhodocyclaceae bacterium]
MAVASAALPVNAVSSDLPELGDAAHEVLPPQLQRKLGAEFYNEIRLREPSYIDDPEVSGYVNRVGRRLVSASADPNGRFTFFV